MTEFINVIVERTATLLHGIPTIALVLVVIALVMLLAGAVAKTLIRTAVVAFVLAVVGAYLGVHIPTVSEIATVFGDLGIWLVSLLT